MDQLRKIPNVTVYKREEMPERYHYAKAEHRLGDVIVLPNYDGLYLSDVGQCASPRESRDSSLRFLESTVHRSRQSRLGQYVANYAGALPGSGSSVPAADGNSFVEKCRCLSHRLSSSELDRQSTRQCWFVNKFSVDLSQCFGVELQPNRFDTDREQTPINWFFTLLFVSFRTFLPVASVALRLSDGD